MNWYKTLLGGVCILANTMYSNQLQAQQQTTQQPQQEKLLTLADKAITQQQTTRAMSILTDYLVINPDEQRATTTLETLWLQADKPCTTIDNFVAIVSTTAFEALQDSLSSIAKRHKKANTTYKGNIRTLYYELSDKVIDSILDARHQPKIEEHLRWASFYSRLDRTTEAINELQEAKKVDADNKIIHYRLGQLYKNTGKETQAAYSFAHNILPSQHHTPSEQALQQIWTNTPLTHISFEAFKKTLINTFTSKKKGKPYEVAFQEAYTQAINK